MKISRLRFNLYLALALPLAALLAAGCHTAAHKQKYQPSTLKIHVEVPPYQTNQCVLVPIYRQHPFLINVDKTPILTELEVVQAQVVDVVGGFAIRLQFNRDGTWLLEENSIEHRGQRFAIFCEFGQGLKTNRWLAAPIISRRISDGVLTFTPDATREESQQIVLGLSNIGREVKKKTDF